METTLKQLDNNKVELTVSLGAEDVDAAVKAAYRDGAQARIPGFRQGKAPRHVLDNFYGGEEYFLAQATDDLVKETYPKAINENDLVLLDEVDFGELDSVKEGQPYTYQMSFTVAPELQLSSYDPVSVELPSEDPSDAEVQAQMDMMMEYYVDFEEVSDRASAPGDILHLKLEVTRDGAPVDGLCGDDMPYELGIEAMPEDFEKHFLGVAAGAELEFDFDLGADTKPAAVPDESEQPAADADAAADAEAADAEAAAAAKPVVMHAQATVHRIEAKHVPELTDAWVKETLEYESVDHFKALIYDSLKIKKSGQTADIKERRVLAAIAARVRGDLPEQLVSQTEKEIYRDIYMSLQEQGMSLDAFLANGQMTPESFRNDVGEQAIENTRQAMALDAWALHFGIDVSEEEIMDEFEKSGADDPKDMYTRWQEAGRLPEIRQGIKRMKASEQLLDQAIVTEEADFSAAGPIDVEPEPEADAEAAAEAAAEPATEAEAAAAAE